MEIFITLLILLFSIILHEYAHGFVAYKNGDDTAYLMGRLTFNPIKHIDPMGTIFLPFLCYLFNLPLFGWARPVPVNFLRLNRPKTDMAKVAFAGPASNLILVALCVIIFKLLILADFKEAFAYKFLSYGVQINLILAIFNLIPVPPLDGSKVIAAFLPDRQSLKYLSLERYGMIFVIILIITGAFRLIVMPVFTYCLHLINLILGA
ncbi:MAG: site-2 protease family protein [Elusimicrobiaceae bacterium]|nr:site-2 protease family protein [Elusimicrobiaceae bacterium]